MNIANFIHRKLGDLEFNWQPSIGAVYLERPVNVHLWCTWIISNCNHRNSLNLDMVEVVGSSPIACTNLCIVNDNLGILQSLYRRAITTNIHRYYPLLLGHWCALSVQWLVVILRDLFSLLSAVTPKSLTHKQITNQNSLSVGWSRKSESIGPLWFSRFRLTALNFHLKGVGFYESLYRVLGIS